MTNDDSTPLDEFIDSADLTMEQVIGMARDPGEPLAEDAQIGMFVADGMDLAGPLLFATGTVANDGGFVSIAVRGFDNKQPIEPEVVTLGDEIIITLKNA